MYLDKEEKDHIIRELEVELHAKLDGSRKNLIADRCPYCGKTGGKYGIYVGPDIGRKKTFMAHCFKCGHSTLTLNQLLTDIGRSDLVVTDTFNLDQGDLLATPLLSDDDNKIDDSLCVVDMPECYKRVYFNKYLCGRGFTEDDYEYFPVGTTRNMNFKFNDYVIFPIIDSGDTVGYVSRHIWSKTEIDEHNRKARNNGTYQIMRYRNSTENDFVKLLYNYDAVIADETDTVILVEGIFDAISLTRKLNLYKNHSIAAVATFGRKISDIQIYKLQTKGVQTIVIGYDGDSVEPIKKISEQLDEYFDVYVADITDPTQDFDDMEFWDIYDAFTSGLKTSVEYKLNKIQL